MSEADVTEQTTKAAIILLALKESYGVDLIKTFAPHEVKTFAASATSLVSVDERALSELVSEFELAMISPPCVEGGEENTRNFLAQALPEGDVNGILGREEKKSVWTKFTTGSENKLCPYLLDEHPQIVTYIISRLDRELSANVIAMLPRELRAEVTRRLLKVQPVQQVVDDVLQERLSTDLLLQTSGAIEQAGRNFMADVLNRMDKTQSEEIIESLKVERPEEAAALQRLLFSFDDIAVLEQKYRLILFDKVQTDQVMLALRGVTGELKEGILSALGARARRMVEAELSSASPEVTKEVIKARQTIASTALKLLASGDIVINLSDVDK